MAFIGGYAVFLPGKWDVPTFLFSYMMIGIFPVLFVGWKVLKKSKWQRPEEVDLLTNKAEVDAYERGYVDPIPRYVSIWSFVDELYMRLTGSPKEMWSPSTGTNYLNDSPHIF